MDWAHRHIDIVQDMAFVAFRHLAPPERFQWFAGGNKVDWQTLPYQSGGSGASDILSTDMLGCVRQVFPEFAPAAYLNGTEDVGSFKWLLSVRIGTRVYFCRLTAGSFVQTRKLVLTR